MRILLDTNLLIRAAITPKGLARELLRLIEADEEHVLVVSPYLSSEVADVLRRDRIRARWPLTDEEIRSYCYYLSTVGEEVSPQHLKPVIRDPKDQAVIETAVAGGATVLPSTLISTNRQCSRFAHRRAYRSLTTLTCCSCSEPA